MPPPHPFWTDFERYAPRLTHVMHTGDYGRAFQAISHLLDGHGLPFCFELASDDRVARLTFSPEGDPAVADQIDAFVATAPRVEGWEIFARRQRKSTEDALDVVKQLYELDAADARFLVAEDDRCGPRIAIYLPAAEPLTDESKVGLAATILWHALGEDLVLRERISAGVIASPAPDHPRVLTLEGLRARFPAE